MVGMLTACRHLYTHAHTHTQQYASSWVVYCLCHTVLVQAHSHNHVYYKRAGRVGRIHGTKKKFVLVPKTGLWLVPMMAPLACATVLEDSGLPDRHAQLWCSSLLARSHPASFAVPFPALHSAQTASRWKLRLP